MKIIGLVIIVASCALLSSAYAEVQTNRLAANGLRTNRLAANGLRTNRLSSNGLRTNRISGNGLRTNRLAANTSTEGKTGLTLTGIVAQNGRLVLSK